MNVHQGRIRPSYHSRLSTSSSLSCTQRQSPAPLNRSITWKLKDWHVSLHFDNVIAWWIAIRRSPHLGLSPFFPVRGCVSFISSVLRQTRSSDRLSTSEAWVDHYDSPACRFSSWRFELVSSPYDVDRTLLISTGLLRPPPNMLRLCLLRWLNRAALALDLGVWIQCFRAERILFDPVTWDFVRWPPTALWNAYVDYDLLHVAADLFAHTHADPLSVRSLWHIAPPPHPRSILAPYTRHDECAQRGVEARMSCSLKWNALDAASSTKCD